MSNNLNIAPNLPLPQHNNAPQGNAPDVNQNVRQHPALYATVQPPQGNPLANNNIALGDGEQRNQIVQDADRQRGFFSSIGNAFRKLYHAIAGIVATESRELRNELEIEDGKVTGRVVGEIVNGERKAVLLQKIAKEEGLSLEQVIAVGDGANDLPMLGVAGLGIAFRAKPLVKESAKQAITTLGLDGILYLIGVRDRDQAELLAKGKTAPQTH